jgi:signal transduction histidine kinase
MLAADRARVSGEMTMRSFSAHPVAVLVAFRWPAWVIALVPVLYGAGRAEHGVSLATLLLVTGLVLLVETVAVWRRDQEELNAPRMRRILLTIAAGDVALGLAAIYLSGGWSSPFYHYAVTALLVPTFLLRLAPALLWCAVFVLGYLGVCLSDAGGGDPGELVTRRMGTLATPLLVVLVMWYLARLTGQRQRASEQAERALTETATLLHVSEAITANLATLEALLDALVEAADRSGLFSALSIRAIDGGSVTVERSFGEIAGEGVSLTLPLEVRGERLGTLIAVPVDPSASGQAEFADALAQQVALGVYDARLFAQREELATQAERARIAREIHDGMAQSLYMLSLGLEACTDAAQEEHGELARRLQSLTGVSKQALWEARRYIFDLTPAAAGEASLLIMLENLTREFETVSRVPVTLAVEGEQRPASAGRAATLYRIAQESLANVFKHAAAGQVRVTLAYLPDALRLTIRDDGRGLPEQPSGGYGLANMRRRAEDAGGVCTIERAEDGGTVVRVELPAGAEPAGSQISADGERMGDAPKGEVTTLRHQG